jgi:hypothetical protein
MLLVARTCNKFKIVTLEIHEESLANLKVNSEIISRQLNKDKT